ncbi:uncharacterized protein LOC141857093 isoform X2 [Brevipalpus obovatus]|uniref:uncharacterized protein LOC141857093 isoform X2 n=1 Tax=Brevipalpus obovatus TaxID=246614 RepID=UPI003D9EC61B
MDQRKGESAAFWHQKYDDVKEELEEYQSSSRELEQELETQLAQSEKKRKELEATLERVKEENDGLKSKLSQVVSESQKQINQLQKDLNHYQAANESLSRAIRELEQSNDDLERAKRALVASLEDFEGRLNQQIEKNVLLENELGEKEELEVVVQRLKDEARDLKYELTLQRQKEPKNVSTSHENRRSSVLEGCSPPVRSPSSNSVVGVNNTSVNSKPRALSCHSSTIVDEKLNCSPSPMKQPRAVPQRLTSASRITALNTVSDLLRKGN